MEHWQCFPSAISEQNFDFKLLTWILNLLTYTELLMLNQETRTTVTQKAQGLYRHRYSHIYAGNVAGLCCIFKGSHVEMPQRGKIFI